MLVRLLIALALSAAVGSGIYFVVLAPEEPVANATVAPTAAPPTNDRFLAPLEPKPTEGGQKMQLDF